MHAVPLRQQGIHPIPYFLQAIFVDIAELEPALEEQDAMVDIPIRQYEAILLVAQVGKPPAIRSILGDFLDEDLVSKILVPGFLDQGRDHLPPFMEREEAAGQSLGPSQWGQEEE